MADIPAANITDPIFNTRGRLKEWIATVTGDGSGVTVPVPFARIKAVFLSQSCLTGSTAQANALTVTWTNGPPPVITYSAAPTNGQVHQLCVVGY